MNAIESLLNAANRSHEESAFYVRRSDGVTRSVRVTRESGDLAPYTADDTPQTYRVVVFSADADSLGGPPQRGDVLYLGAETFRVVEQDGVTWQRRFETYGGRIFFFTEKVSDITVPAPPGGDGPYVPPEVCSSVFDEVSITLSHGKWGVDANFMEGELRRAADNAVARAKKLFLPRELLPYPEWDDAADYEVGDIVYQDGTPYIAIAANRGREPRAYSVGVGAVWKALVFDSAAFAAVSGTIRTTDEPTPGTASPGSGSGSTGGQDSDSGSAAAPADTTAAQSLGSRLLAPGFAVARPDATAEGWEPISPTPARGWEPAIANPGSGPAQLSGGSLPRPVSGTENLIPTTAAVVEYVESRFSDAETQTITGDGITRVFELPLEGARKPAVELYNAAGRRCFCANTGGGAGKVTLIFYEAPEAGETFRVVLR